MSGKRQASYTIDPITLQEKDKDQDTPVQQDITGDKLPKEQRKIFKIKRPGQADPSEQKESKVTFKLNESQQIKPSSDDTKGAESTEKPAQKEAVNPFANLFKADKNIFNGIGIFSNTNSVNIFTSNQGTQQTAQAQANSTTGPSIFSTNTTNGKNLFNNAKSSLKNTSASLFSQGTPAQDEDGSGDSAQLEQAQKVESDPTKSVATYNYDDSCPVLLSLRVSKFKKIGSELIENVEIVLQKQKQTSVKYITVRLPATKKNIFSGILVDGKSQVKHLHGKKQNVEVSALQKQKGAFSKVVLRFQFEKEEDGEKLFERLEELLSVKKEESSEAQKEQPK